MPKNSSGLGMDNYFLLASQLEFFEVTVDSRGSREIQSAVERLWNSIRRGGTCLKNCTRKENKNVIINNWNTSSWSLACSRGSSTRIRLGLESVFLPLTFSSPAVCMHSYRLRSSQSFVCQSIPLRFSKTDCRGKIMVQICKEFAFLCHKLDIWCPRNFHVRYVQYPISDRRSFTENWYQVRCDAWIDWGLCSTN